MSTAHRPVVRVVVRPRLSQAGRLVLDRVDVGWPKRVREGTAWQKLAFVPWAYPGAITATCTGVSRGGVVVEGDTDVVERVARRHGIGPTVRIETDSFVALHLSASKGTVRSGQVEESVWLRGAGDVTVDAGQVTPLGLTRLVGVAHGLADLPRSLRAAAGGSRSGDRAGLAGPRSGAALEDAPNAPGWTSPRDDLPFSETDAVVKLRDMAEREAWRIEGHEHADLVQVAMVAVVRAHRVFPYRSWEQYVGYARTAARNALVSYARKQNRERHDRLSEQDGWEWPSLDGIVDLHRALRETPHARLLVLHAAGYSDADLARRLGVSKAAARKRRQRATDAVRDALEVP